LSSIIHRQLYYHHLLQCYLSVLYEFEQFGIWQVKEWMDRLTDRALTRSEAGRSQLPGHRRAGASSGARPAPGWGRSAGPGPPAAGPAACGPRRRRAPSLHQQFTCHVTGCRQPQRERESERAGKATTRNKHKPRAGGNSHNSGRERARRDAEPVGKRNRQHCCSHLRAQAAAMCARAAPTNTPARPRFDWGCSLRARSPPRRPAGRRLVAYCFRARSFSAYGESPTGAHSKAW